MNELTCQVEVVLDELLGYLAEVFVTRKRGEPCLREKREEEGEGGGRRKEEGWSAQRDPLPSLFSALLLSSQLRTKEHVLTIQVRVDV